MNERRGVAKTVANLFLRHLTNKSHTLADARGFTPRLGRLSFSSFTDDVHREGATLPGHYRGGINQYVESLLRRQPPKRENCGRTDRTAVYYPVGLDDAVVDSHNRC